MCVCERERERALLGSERASERERELYSETMSITVYWEQQERERQGENLLGNNVHDGGEEEEEEDFIRIHRIL